MADEAQSPADVADDYRLALEDLNSIVKADISTLTTIARENTEHAQAITDVLHKHILKAPAHKKLPAIYVLDSIVKNVGTPYTLFFAPLLYKTFTEAYLAVDGHVRRKMEETLRTWKQPVPQSLDDRPVFPNDVTQPIEDALNKARSLTMQTQGGRGGYPMGRGRPVAGPNRATPTPPGVRAGSGHPGYLGVGHPHQPAHFNGSRPSSAQQGPHAASPYPPPHSYNNTPTGTNPNPYQPPPNFPPGAPHAGLQTSSSVEVDAINRDIDNLIGITQAEVGQNPNDQGIQQRLKGLRDLKSVLQIQAVPHDQLVLVKNQVADLAVKIRPSSVQNSAPAAATVSYSNLAPAPAAAPHAAPVIPQPQQPPNGSAAQQQSSVTLDSLFGQGALATLMSRQSSGTPQASPTPPQMPLGNMPVRSSQPPPAEPPQQSSAAPASSLLENLRKAGLLSSTTPSSTPPAPAQAPNIPPTLPPGAPPAGLPVPPPGVGILPPNIASLLSSNVNSGLSISGQIMDTIQLTAASLKHEFRGHLLPSFYDALGPQCTQCGRRFSKDNEGKRKKTAHMDWHFQVRHRVAEAERRGQHRSWYVDEGDWIASRETLDIDHARSGGGADGDDTALNAGGGGPGASGTQGGAGKDQQPPETQYIVVPDASAGVNNTCPICREKFQPQWLDAPQDFVWMDAMLVGGNRAYHISCHAEATKARDEAPARSTPEPVLGKRKAEDELKNLRKIKTDGA